MTTDSPPTTNGSTSRTTTPPPSASRYHAQDALGDVVFVDLPAVGASFKKGEVAGVVESVKAAADVYMPVSGEVVEVNEALRDNPSLANTDPLGNGWFFKVKIADMTEFDQLMDVPGLRRAARRRSEACNQPRRSPAMLMSAPPAPRASSRTLPNSSPATSARRRRRAAHAAR